MYDYLDDRQTKRLKELVPYKILAPDADEIIEELDRLNKEKEKLQNIIKEANEYIEKYLEREYFDTNILETNTIYNRDLFKVKQILDKEE